MILGADRVQPPVTGAEQVTDLDVVGAFEQRDLKRDLVARGRVGNEKPSCNETTTAGTRECLAQNRSTGRWVEVFPIAGDKRVRARRRWDPIAGAAAVGLVAQERDEPVRADEDLGIDATVKDEREPEVDWTDQPVIGGRVHPRVVDLE